jgi:N-methylhydantoinase B
VNDVTQIATAPARQRDPVRTEVIRHGLQTAAEQMALALRRTAFSSVIYEVNDFACALYDDQRRLLAQAPVFPLFLGTLHFCIDAALRAVGGVECLAPGDVVFTNYAYDVGSHAQDAVVVVPAFFEERVTGYAVVKAHHLDFGAKEFFCTDTTDVFQEGTIVPGVKLYKQGVLDDELYRILLTNSRLPVSVGGDLHAEISATRVGIAGLVRLLERFGRAELEAAVEEMFDGGEQITRAFLAGVPDGRYVGAGALDDNGIDSEPVPIEVALTIDGSDVTIDFSASADQQPGPVNCPFPSTVSAARMAIMALVGEHGTVNEGHLRPIVVQARDGSIYQPRPPAPVYLYYWAAVQAVDLVHRALAGAIPDVIGAGSATDVCCLIWWGRARDGSMWSEGMNHPSGQGAAPASDGGGPLIHIASAGMRNHPVEVWEARRPVIVDRMELMPDSAGPGEFRGGLGILQEYRALEECWLTLTLERTKEPSWGVSGGRPGTPNYALMRLADGTVTGCSRATGQHVPPGAIVEVFSGGGAGFGDPSRRDPETILDDLREGYLTVEGAREQYGFSAPAD